MLHTARSIVVDFESFLHDDEKSETAQVFMANVADDEVMATKSIHLKLTNEERKNLFNLCHRSKNLFNNVWFLLKQFYYLPKYNANVSFEKFIEKIDILRDMMIPISNITDTNKRLEVETRLTSLRKKLTTHNLSLRRELFFIFNYLKSYKHIGHTLVAQEILKEICSQWESFVKKMRLFYRKLQQYKQGKRKNEPSRPKLPYYLRKNGEFLVRYNRQHSVDQKRFREHLQQTTRVYVKKSSISVTAEFVFPKSHEKYIRPIRIRLMPWLDKRSKKLRKMYEKLGITRLKKYAIKQFFERFRTITISPHHHHYVALISYARKKALRNNLDPLRCVSIDLGFNILMTAVNNFGMPPLLYRGNEIKHANYTYITRSAQYQREIDIIRDIEENYYRKHRPIPEIIKERIVKFYNDLATPSSNKYLQKLRKIISDLRERESKLYDKYQRKKISFQLRLLKMCRHNLRHYIACQDYFITLIRRKIKFLKNLREQLQKFDAKRFLDHIKTLRQQAESNLYALLRKRNNLIIDQRHKISNNLINYCVLHRAKTIILGYKKGWKNSNLTRKFNRQWRWLPIRDVIDTIKYKASLVGIKIIFNPETYTSTVSSLDREYVGKKENYKGLRSPPIPTFTADGHKTFYYPRGLYYSTEKKQYIHSDANGGFNIMHRHDQMTQRLAKIKKGKKVGITPTYFFDRVKDADMLISPFTVNLHTNNNVRPIASV